QPIEPEAAAHVADGLAREQALADEHLLEGQALLARARRAPIERLGRHAPRVAEEGREIAVAVGRTHVDDLPLSEQHVTATDLEASVGPALGEAEEKDRDGAGGEGPPGHARTLSGPAKGPLVLFGLAELDAIPRRLVPDPAASRRFSGISYRKER